MVMVFIVLKGLGLLLFIIGVAGVFVLALFAMAQMGKHIMNTIMTSKYFGGTED